MNTRHNSRTGSILRITVRLGLIAVFAYGVHLLLDWLQYRIDDREGSGSTAMLTSVVFLILVVYALLIAVPFVPGIEIGMSLLALQGASIAPMIYVFTVLGLSTSFLVGRTVPVHFVQRVLSDLGLRKFSAALGELDQLSPQGKLDRLTKKLPWNLGTLLAKMRYLLLALLINLPGNALIGGGGGICLSAGLSRVFNPAWTFLTIAIAVAPVPLGVYFMWSGFEAG